LGEEGQGKDIASLSFILAYYMLRLLARKLQDGYKHVQALKTSIRASVPPKWFANHVALAYSIGWPSSFTEEKQSDAMMEEKGRLEESPKTFGGIGKYFQYYIRLGFTTCK